MWKRRKRARAGETELIFPHREKRFPFHNSFSSSLRRRRRAPPESKMIYEKAICFVPANRMKEVRARERKKVFAWFVETFSPRFCGALRLSQTRFMVIDLAGKKCVSEWKCISGASVLIYDSWLWRRTRCKKNAKRWKLAAVVLICTCLPQLRHRISE